ncbi:MAG: hypothetical protein FI707_17740 [SAR202 cluster bacterium]|jgi:hypothetical protein|nr:hypothetical protein [Chloroflexota bacterium]MDP6421329.1 YIP1 family protein [SAR202 cluster bacterium]HAL48077.1 hypothetical protein [Dehalococcoidia bacterium]MDP6665560.1 YIP1 family protein [SAR202 cluster bacterium]MDP6799201.1 YIP1 family protein [SAR202 cluster bacterium]|tara:strand:- start:1255 stop:1800 length:546 start_codon:yes stop_codon:yes gene_type:complete
MLNQALRAALLDSSVFDEFSEEPESMFRSMGVVFVAALGFGLGIWSEFRTGAASDESSALLMLMFVAVSTIVLGWSVCAVLVWAIGNKGFGSSTGYRQGLRALGICFGPIALWLFLNVPVIGAPLALLGHLWTLPACVVAVHKALELAWWKAGIAVLFGWSWGLVVIPLFLVLIPAADEFG